MIKTLRSFILLAIILVFSASDVLSQFDSPVNPVAGEGIVILHNGDTLHGRVNWRMKYIDNYPSEIKFIPDNGQTVIYTASDIEGVVVYPVDFDTSEELAPETYVSLPSLKKKIPVFYNRMVEGKINIFQNRTSTVFTKEVGQVTTEFDGIGFSYSKKDGLTVGLVFKETYRVLESKTRYSSYYVSKNGEEMIRVDKDNYDVLFPALFGDCQAIRQETDKNPDLLKFRNFVILPKFTITSAMELIVQRQAIIDRYGLRD